MNRILLIESAESAFVVDDVTVTEATKTKTSSGLTLVKGVVATKLGVKNSNGRVYTKKMMDAAISDCTKKGVFENRSLLCAADDHPKSTHVSPINASHVVTRAYTQVHEGVPHMMNDWLILPTSNGKNLQALVDAKVAIGTSIRGLGKVNESTSEVDDYQYLGTDAVGNPSAGTFATPNIYKVQTESVDLDLNLESIIKSVEESAMSFDLKSATGTFRNKYYKNNKAPVLSESKDLAREIVSEIVKIEVQAVKEGIELDQNFIDMKEEVLGQLGTVVENDPAKNDNLVAESNDLVTKLQRKLGAEQAVSSFLVQNNSSMTESIESLKNTIKSYNEVLESVKTEVRDLLEGKDEDYLVLTKEEREGLREEIKQKMIDLVSSVQKEAKETILNLESTLHTATTTAEVITEQFFAMQWLASSLAEKVKKFTEASRKKSMTYTRTLEGSRKSR